MAVITVSRQYASGGSDIARRVAERLGWALIDNEFVDRVAELAGLAPEEVEAREERVPGLMERLARTLATSSPEVFIPTGEPAAALTPQERIVAVTERVIREAAQHGDVVMVGRGAQAYLGERKDVLHVFTVAPRRDRIDAAIERLGQTRADAQHCVDDVDSGRRAYVKTHYKRNWDDPANYDLVLNTAELGYAGSADLIVAAAGTKGLTRP
ncbi:MAG TPA: cytidylate kinase-like family protein [Gemmatimonadales bacterium]